MTTKNHDIFIKKYCNEIHVFAITNRAVAFFSNYKGKIKGATLPKNRKIIVKGEENIAEFLKKIPKKYIVIKNYEDEKMENTHQSQETYVILGADDPEMREIERVAEKAGAKTVFATENGVRVHPGNAYEADDPVVTWGIPWDARKLVVECGWAQERMVVTPGIVIIDHHRPGDPGYDLPPKEFWKASSLGQVHRNLEILATDASKMIAALDHCPAAAMRGECRHQIGEVAAVNARRAQIQEQFPDVDIISLVGKAKEEVFYGTPEKMGEYNVTWTCGTDFSPGYSPEYLCLQQAGYEMNRPIMFTHRDFPGGKRKIVINASEKIIEYFMKTWAPEKGLTKIYGNPQRGYAGAYEK